MGYALDNECVGILIHHYRVFYNPVQPVPILSLTNTVNKLLHFIMAITKGF